MSFSDTLIKSISTLIGFISGVVSFFIILLRRLYDSGREKLTIMIIPHSEHGIRNLHVPVWLVMLLFTIANVAALVSLFYFANISVNAKEISRLEKYKDINRHNLVIYSNEIRKFQEVLDRADREVKGLASFAKKKSTVAMGGNEVELEEARKYGDIVTPESDSEDTEIISGAEVTTLKRLHERLINYAGITEGMGAFLNKKQSTAALLPTLWPLKDAPSLDRSASSSEKINLTVFPGAPVYASGDGKVVETHRRGQQMFSVVIDHGYGIFSEYSLLASVNVKLKDKVKKGEQVGATSDRLRYAVRLATRYVKPSLFIGAKE